METRVQKVNKTLLPCGTCIRWYLRTRCARVKEIDIFKKLIQNLLLLSIKTDQITGVTLHSELISELPSYIYKFHALSSCSAAHRHSYNYGSVIFPFP